MPFEDSVSMMELMDSLRKQWGAGISSGTITARKTEPLGSVFLAVVPRKLTYTSKKYTETGEPI
jgi:hypothetical protein